MHYVVVCYCCFQVIVYLTNSNLLFFSVYDTFKISPSPRKFACEQALHLGDIVKSELARGTREETRKRGAGRRELARSRAARPNKTACSHELSIHYILL